MGTDEMVRYLRCIAEYGAEITQNDKDVFTQAADRLEEQEERLAIMAANMDEVWGRNYG